MRVEGAVNIVLFVLVIATIILSGQLSDLGRSVDFPPTYARSSSWCWPSFR